MSKKRKSTGSRPSLQAAPGKQNGPKSPVCKKARQKTMEEMVDAFNAKWDPHNLRPQLKPGHTRILASGTGFNTAGKTPKKANPELEELSKELGLSAQDITLLAEMFPPKNP